MKAFRVIIYDCDGVLIDSRRANAAYYNHILARFGRPPLNPEQLAFVQVSTALEAINYLFHGTPWLEDAQAYQRNLDNRPFIPLIRLEPNILETLASLRPAYRTAVATNRGKSLPLVLGHHGLAHLFDLTVSSLDVPEPKPHPGCLEKVLQHFQAPAREALYIGDAAVDALVSRRARVPFVAYRNPALPARYHLEDHLDLLKILAT